MPSGGLRKVREMHHHMQFVSRESTRSPGGRLEGYMTAGLSVVPTIDYQLAVLLGGSGNPLQHSAFLY